MYEIYAQIRDERGLTDYKVAKMTGIGQIYIGSQEAELRKNMAAATAVFEAMQPPAQP